MPIIKLDGYRNPAFYPMRLGALGVTGQQEDALKGTGISVGATVAGAASATSLATAGAIAGSAVPVVGTVIGAVVGLAVGALLKKNYLSVANVNADEDNQIAAFNQYKRIAGQAPGRQFGLAAMRYVWKGALYSGHFPKNNAQLCYHNGCFKYRGQPSMIDDVLDKNCGDGNCFKDVLPQWLAARSSSSATPVARIAAVSRIGAPRAVPRIASVRATGGASLRGLSDFIPRPTSMRPTLPPEMMRYSRSGFKGFGALGRMGALGQTSAPSPDAVVFIDQFFIPAQARCTAASGCAWAVPTDPVGHQLLYDVADAWLAANAGVNTTPFVAAGPVAAQTPTVPGGSTIVPGTAAVTPVGASNPNFVSVPGLSVSSTPIGYVGSTLSQPVQAYIQTSVYNAAQAIIAGSVPAFTPTTVPVYYNTGAGFNQASTIQFGQLFAYFWPGLVSASGYSGGSGAASPNPQPILSPLSTPLFTGADPATAGQAQAVTTVTGATSANLDAQLAAQGFTRVGTAPASGPSGPGGLPIYADNTGKTYVYSNGGLYPYGTVAQLASTGNVGTGISTPTTGLDATTLAAIQSALAQGATPPQASAAGAALLQAQGVPITPTVQSQLDTAAAVPATSAGSGISSNVLLWGGGALLLFLLMGRRKAA